MKRLLPLLLALFITVPSAGGGIDSYTVCMLHFEGVNGGLVFTDDSDSEHVFTATHSSGYTTSTTRKKFGDTSLFAATHLRNISTPHSSDFNFVDGDFTIDFWFNMNYPDNCRDMFGKSLSWEVDRNKTNGDMIFRWSTDGATWTNSKTWSTSMSHDVFYHLAFERYGGNLYFYVDGTAVGSPVSCTETFYSNTSVFKIGGPDYQQQFYDEFRISKGIARYGGTNFTPETEPYTAPVASGIAPSRRTVSII